MADYPSITLSALGALLPCPSRYDAVRALLASYGDEPINAAQAVAAGIDLDDLVWAASAVACKDADVARRRRLWLADCAAHVLPVYERAHPGDDRVRAAIQAARDYARGELDASAAAWAAAAASAAARAAAAASAAAWSAAWSAGDAAAAGDAASAAAWSVAAKVAEEQWQLQRLVLWLTDEPDDWPLDQKEEADAA